MEETSPQTIARVVGAYDLGRKLRELRLKKKVALTDLASHTGLSASMLSQLETGRLIPTLPTLTRIALVFDVGLEHFFSFKRRKPALGIVRKDERMRFPDNPQVNDPSFFFESLAFAFQGKVFEPYLAEFPVRKKHSATHQHAGAEFIYVLEGVLVLRLEGEEHRLEAGDSAYFDPETAHSYAAGDGKPARALVVVSARAS